MQTYHKHIFKYLKKLGEYLCPCGSGHNHEWKIYWEDPKGMMTVRRYEECLCGARQDYYSVASCPPWGLRKTTKAEEKYARAKAKSIGIIL